jgi:hypothetical protein
MSEENDSFSIEVTNAWTLVAVSGGILLLYCMSRIIAMQRRVRDLEARPPVDDILMRGMIRQQVSEMVSELEQSIRVRTAATKTVSKEVYEKPFVPAAQVQPSPPVQPVLKPVDTIQPTPTQDKLTEVQETRESEVVVELPPAPPNSAESKTKKKAKKTKT